MDGSRHVITQTSGGDAADGPVVRLTTSGGDDGKMVRRGGRVAETEGSGLELRTDGADGVDTRACGWEGHPVAAAASSLGVVSSF